MKTYIKVHNLNEDSVFFYGSELQDLEERENFTTQILQGMVEDGHVFLVSRISLSEKLLNQTEDES